MAQNFGANSTQGSILLTCQSASTETIRVTDASGNVLAEFTPAKAYTCLVVSTPALTQDSTCTVTMGGQSTNVTLESLIYGSGGMGGSMGTPPDGNNGGSMGTPPDGNGGKGSRPGHYTSFLSPSKIDKGAPLHEMRRGVLTTALFMGQSICYPTDNETNLGGIADEASDWFLCARIRAGGGARSGSTGGNGGRSVRRARVFPRARPSLQLL